MRTWISIIILLVCLCKDMESSNLHFNNCSCTCPEKIVGPRIVGGVTTEPDAFPWLVLLTDLAYVCSGTLITFKHIMTAAHCLKQFADVDNIIIWDPNYALFSLEAFNMEAKKMVYHPLFNGYAYDIGIIELHNPIKRDGLLQPACIAKINTENYEGKLATIAGWGLAREGGSFDGILRKVSVPILSHNICQSNYKKLVKKLSKAVVCAGYPEGGKDACQGDSGGPLHLNRETGHTDVIGIVSFGEGCARPNKPGVYTKVAYFYDWITSIVGSECLCKPPTVE